MVLLLLVEIYVLELLLNICYFYLILFSMLISEHELLDNSLDDLDGLFKGALASHLHTLLILNI